MNRDELTINYRHLTATTLVAALVFVAFFPVSYLEFTLQSTVNHWAPEKIHVDHLSFTGPLQSELEVSFTIKDYVYTVPLRVRATPGWSTFTFNAESQFDGFRTQLSLYDRTLSGEFNDFPLQKFFYGVNGPANGNFRFQRTDSGLSGSFLLKASTSKPITPSPLIPPMVYGQTIETFHCKGEINGKTISSDDFRLKTDQAYLKARGSMDVRAPVGKSFLNATLNMQWPVNKTIRLNDTLEGIGLL